MYVQRAADAGVTTFPIAVNRRDCANESVSTMKQRCAPAFVLIIIYVGLKITECDGAPMNLVEGGMEGWRDGGMEGWRDGGMEGWRDGGMEGWRDGGMEGWRDGGMEGWRDGGMEGWRDGGMEGGRERGEDIDCVGEGRGKGGIGEGEWGRRDGSTGIRIEGDKEKDGDRVNDRDVVNVR